MVETEKTQENIAKDTRKKRQKDLEIDGHFRALFISQRGRVNQRLVPASGVKVAKGKSALECPRGVGRGESERTRGRCRPPFHSYYKPTTRLAFFLYFFLERTGGW